MRGNAGCDDQQSRHRTTAGYAHLADADLLEAAETVGAVIAPDGRRETRRSLYPVAAAYQRRPPRTFAPCSAASSLAASRRAASRPSENDCHRPDASRQPRR